MKYYKKKIFIIGLGYVGLPMLVCLAKKNRFNIYGVEKNNKLGEKKILSLKEGINPIKSNDVEFNKQFKKLNKNKNVNFVSNLKNLSEADIVLVSVGFDFTKSQSLSNLKNLSYEISNSINSNTLIIFETTLPPGTCDKVIIPIFKSNFKKRNLPISNINLSYSYERIMPGKNYLNSITNVSRCYSAMNKNTEKKLIKFFSSFIKINKYPLQKFEKFIECETSKIIENSYRALNIAFIDEWTKFSLRNSLNLNKILRSIRIRKTHNNIMNTGVGVGGYCLTKDGLFGKISEKLFHKKIQTKFKLTTEAMKINKEMPNTSIRFLKDRIKLKNKKILIVGITYKEDVGDLRSSPILILINKLAKFTKKIYYLDPFFDKDIENAKNINKFNNIKLIDTILFCQKHSQIKKFDYKKFSKKCKFFDLNHVLDKKLKKQINRKNLYTLGDFTK